MSRKWTEAEREKLTQLAERYGCNKAGCKEIGKRLERSWKSVWNMIRREGGAIGEQDTFDTDVEAEKQKARALFEKRQIAQQIKRVASIDILADKIKGSIEALPPVRVPSIKDTVRPKHCGGEEIAGLMLSDIHCGEIVRLSETSGLGEYSIDIFKNRLRYLFDSVLSIVDLHRNSYPVKKLVMLWLGDFVHGARSAGAWSSISVGQSILDQVFLCAQWLIEEVLRMCANFEQVEIYAVPGNHGRTSKEDEYHANWDNVIYKHVEGMLGNQPNLAIHTTYSKWLVANIGGVDFLCLHGEGIKSWAGIPYYGVQRTESKLSSLLTRSDKSEMTTPPKYLALGHFHSPADLPINGGGKILMNGSFSGGDDYSINQLWSAYPAEQKMFGISPRRKAITWKYDLELQAGDKI